MGLKSKNMADQGNPPQDPPVPPQASLPGGGGGDERNQIPINIEDEMKRSYLDYAMSVIVGRALPDIRDGLKPVHPAHSFRNERNGPACYAADAQVRQDRPAKCWGKFHPHGDASVYDSLVRMAQDFSMRYRW